MHLKPVAMVKICLMSVSTKSVPKVITSSDFIARLGKLSNTRTVADWSRTYLLELGLGPPDCGEANGAPPDSGEAWGLGPNFLRLEC